MTRGQPRLLLCNGLVSRGTGAPAPADVLISAEGRILDIDRSISTGERSIDLDGRLITPGFVDMHQHLDKSCTLAEAPNPDGTLKGAIEAFRAYSKGLTSEAILERAKVTIDRCIAMGTCAIRTHANLDYELGLKSVQAMCELREASRGRIHVDVVAFATSSAARGDPAGARDLLERAIAAGADCVGGTPNLASDPMAYIDMLLDVAERHGLSADLHIDETLDPSARWFDYLVEQTKQRGMGGKVVGSHVSSLSALRDDEARRSIEAAADAGVAVCTLPAANLFLQGRETRQLVPRGLTRVVELLRAGVPVATASDNIQDAFVPVGSGDLLEVARWTIVAGHLMQNALQQAFRMITDTPARLIGIGAEYGLRPNALADLVVSRSDNVDSLVAAGTTDRSVMHRGVFIAGPLCGA